MSADSFTEVSHESWFGRIGGAIKGILFGLLLFVVAFPLLFWNEGRAVKRYKTLKEGGAAVVSVASDQVDPANQGKLVHVTGKAETDATLTDPVFGVSAPGLKLKRVAEMYQWKESSNSKTQKKLGGGSETVKTYTYNKTWSQTATSSDDFKEPAGHQNPTAMEYETTEQTADKVTLGAFTLSPSLIGMIDDFEPLAAGGAALPEALKDKAKPQGGGFYIGANPASPQVGDERIKFEVAKPTDVSVIAMQEGSTFAPYVAKAGGTIELLQTGIQPAAVMFQRAQSGNRLLTWGLRFGGFLLMLIGLILIMKPLSIVADVLPILGTIVGAGTGIMAFLLSAVLSLITIATAWIVYRPLLGIVLIVAAGVLVWAVKGKLKVAKRKA